MITDFSEYRPGVEELVNAFGWNITRIVFRFLKPTRSFIDQSDSDSSDYYIPGEDQLVNAFGWKITKIVGGFLEKKRTFIDESDSESSESDIFAGCCEKCGKMYYGEKFDIRGEIYYYPCTTICKACLDIFG